MEKAPLIYSSRLYRDEISQIIEELQFSPYSYALNKTDEPFHVGPLSLVSSRIAIGLEGSFDIRYLHTTFHLEKGDYLFLPAASMIYIDSCDKSNACVNIDYEFVSEHALHEVSNYIGEGEAVFIKGLLNDSHLFNLTMVNEAVKKHQPGSFILVKTTLEKISLLAIKYELENHQNRLPYKEKPNQKEKLCRTCMKYIDDHISESISIEEMAKHCNYSTNYIYKSFSECLECSTQHYILIRRLYKSVRELRVTEKTIESIAAQFGFNSIYHFSNAFKKEFGISPSSYRKAQKSI